jgi:CRP-like cAMP-binding protein
MTTPGESPAATGNSFIDSLPLATRLRLAPALQRIELHIGRVLAKPGVNIENVFFPTTGVISTVTQMVEGDAVEVGLSGHEGFGPISLAFGSKLSPHMAVVQIPGNGCVISAARFLQGWQDDDALRTHASAYSEYCYVAAAQFAACNRRHSVRERYARWILMADDRVGNGEFVLTHEYLGQMLGVRRASVTIVAGEFVQAGLISNRRRHVCVLDRPNLEDASCECYTAVNSQLYRLMGYGARQVPNIIV